MQRSMFSMFWLGVLTLVGMMVTPLALMAAEPQTGGILKVAIAGDPPSLDMHQEQTFMVTIPMSTVYNTLVMFDPHGFPEIIGDLAKSWERSEDGKTWTFKLHEGVTFHEATP
jgi:peptide/nickel transport system substrate-binding protein